jgi:ABC-type protease/lipase transport system fused ATPase/permease subunit
VVLVSHRFVMMRVVDMIGVLQGGVLARFGPRDQMLQELQAVPQAPARKVAALSDSA